MGQSLHVEIYDRSNGSRTIQVCEAPFEIGKQPQTASAIRLDPSQVTISRVHGRVETTGDTIVYTDSSSNGSTVAGTFLKGKGQPVAYGDVIKIENYELRILEVRPVLIKHTAANLDVLGEQDIEPGGSLVLAKTDKLVLLPDTPEANEKPVVGRIHSDGITITIELYEAGAMAKVKVNKHLSSDSPVSAKVDDVFEIDGDRFEVLRRDQKKIVCGNAACHLLNDLPFEENCVWCGHYLAASGSFTRVTLP